MGIDIIYLKFPESVKKKFINWVNSLNFNPYDQKYYYPIPSYRNVINKKAGILLKQLYPSLDSSLKKFLEIGVNPKILVLKNLPLDKDLDKLPTPKEGEIPKKKSYVSELMIIALSYNLNSYIKIYPDDPKPFNLPFHQVVPHKGEEKKEAVNYGAGNFPFHNDRIHKEPVDFHLLYGLRAPTEVNTYFLAIKDLISEMPRDLYLILFEKKFITSKSNKTISILHENPKKLDYVTSSLDLAEGWINPTNKKSKLALEWLREKAISKTTLAKAKKINITPGTAVISDHLRILHGRKAFFPSNNKFRRWMQRSYLCRKNE